MCAQLTMWGATSEGPCTVWADLGPPARHLTLNHKQASGPRQLEHGVDHDP